MDDMVIGREVAQDGQLSVADPVRLVGPIDQREPSLRRESSIVQPARGAAGDDRSSGGGSTYQRP